MAYRARQAPHDLIHLVWFFLRGHARWAVKGWCWITHGDLRADARAARLGGDSEARRAPRRPSALTDTPDGPDSGTPPASG